ncbi:NACHT, LRR and PYD domains-containing protein 14, partial [Manis javanica]
MPTVTQVVRTSLALIHNQNLMHLSLKRSDIGDNGGKASCETLNCPDCELQNQRLRHCHFTALSSEHLSSSLLHKSLPHLDLGSNQLHDDGVMLLCDVFWHPCCDLQHL